MKIRLFLYLSEFEFLVLNTQSSVSHACDFLMLLIFGWYDICSSWTFPDRNFLLPGLQKQRYKICSWCSVLYALFLNVGIVCRGARFFQHSTSMCDMWYLCLLIFKHWHRPVFPITEQFSSVPFPHSYCTPIIPLI